MAIFDDQEHAKESNRLAAGWVELNLRSVLPNACQIEKGTVKARKSSRRARA